MSRKLEVVAAQMGPIGKDETRTQVVARQIEMLREAASRGADLVVFPELALTTFFPRWDLDDDELLTYFETEMPGPETLPLFQAAEELGVGFHLGYAELTSDGHRYNSAIVVERDGTVVSRYRKVHLPGHEEPEGWRPFQHLERKHFEPGPEGFHTNDAFGGVIGVALCNDRRWSETYRVLGLKGCELLMIGYNTPLHYPPDPGQDHLQAFHSNLCMASGAYQNGMYVVGVAKCGVEEGVEMLGDSQVIAPSGEVVARAATTEDELVYSVIDLDLTSRYKQTVFDFMRYRRPEVYGTITAPKVERASAGPEGVESDA